MAQKHLAYHNDICPKTGSATNCPDSDLVDGISAEVITIVDRGAYFLLQTHANPVLRCLKIKRHQ